MGERKGFLKSSRIVVTRFDLLGDYVTRSTAYLYLDDVELGSI